MVFHEHDMVVCGLPRTPRRTSARAEEVHRQHGCAPGRPKRVELGSRLEGIVDVRAQGDSGILPGLDDWWAVILRQPEFRRWATTGEALDDGNQAVVGQREQDVW